MEGTVRTLRTTDLHILDALKEIPPPIARRLLKMQEIAERSPKDFAALNVLADIVLSRLNNATSRYPVGVLVDSRATKEEPT
jgi:hypothetical protein